MYDATDFRRLQEALEALVEKFDVDRVVSKLADLASRKPSMWSPIGKIYRPACPILSWIRSTYCAAPGCVRTVADPVRRSEPVDTVRAVISDGLAWMTSDRNPRTPIAKH